MYKINPSLCSACFLLCSAQVFTVWAEAGPKKGIINHLPQKKEEALNESALGNKDNKLNK